MRRIVLISSIVLFATCAHGQQLPLSAQYVINPTFLSPAFSGHSTNYETFLGYQRSWLSIPGAPELKLFNLNGPLGENMGLGGGIVDDQVGIFRSLQMNVSYAYHLKVGETSRVSFGTQVSLIDQHIEMPASGLSDPAALLAQGNQKKHMNLGVGINYQWKQLDVGVVLPYLLESTTKASDTASAAYIQSRHYRFYARYLYDITPDISVTPVAVINMTSRSFNADVNALVNYKKIAWIGLGYNTGNTINFHLGGLPIPFLAMQYSFGISGSGILADSKGNHELTLGLLIGAKESNNTSIFRRKATEKQKSYYKWLNF